MKTLVAFLAVTLCAQTIEPDSTFVSSLQIYINGSPIPIAQKVDGKWAVLDTVTREALELGIVELIKNYEQVVASHSGDVSRGQMDQCMALAKKAIESQKKCANDLTGAAKSLKSISDSMKAVVNAPRK